MIGFGTRRVHPALAPIVERSSILGGLDSVSNVLGARMMKREASGTMPHAFVLCVGDEAEAWRIFDRALPADIPRIALVDTFSDEKFASIARRYCAGSGGRVRCAAVPGAAHYAIGEAPYATARLLAAFLDQAGLP